VICVMTLSENSKKISVALIGLLVFGSVFVRSPVVYSLGFRSLLVMPLSLIVLLVVLILHNRKLPIGVVLFVLAALVTSSITGLYWGSWMASLLPSLFGVSLLTAFVASNKELKKTVTIGSVILLVFLLGAWLAFVLQLFGVSSVGTFYSASGRAIEFYYLSLAIPIHTDFIRPSGIYDEPGAFSFVICVFALLRNFMNLDKRLTWSLLFLGFVTFSLAHLVYVFFHFLAERNILRSFKKIMIVGCVFVAVLSTTGIWHNFEHYLLGRLALSTNSDRIFVGDNRSSLLANAVTFLKNSEFKQLSFGTDLSCIEGTTECGKKIPGVGSNPLSPLVYRGILITWPYYLYLFFSLGFGVVRREFMPLFAIGLLFMQRPSVMSSGYSMLAALVLVVFLRFSAWEKIFEGLLGVRTSAHIRQPAVRESL
jgi:hypothetical protein